MKIRRHHHRINAQQLTLFAWADAREHLAMPFPARALSRRFNLTPRRAALIAELAGLGPRQ